MKPIHKLNNGRGATLCNTCSVIISTGLTEELYCEKCKPKQETTLEEAKKQQFKYDNLQDAKEISSRIKVVETLEEAAEWLNKRFDGKGVEIKVIDWNKNETTNYPPSKLLEEYAKWQQERSYSEEEVLEIIRQYALEEHLITSSKPDIWFEQFKKK